MDLMIDRIHLSKIRDESCVVRADGKSDDKCDALKGIGSTRFDYIGYNFCVDINGE